METVKQVTLVLDDSWISGVEICEVVESLARIPKVEWRL